MSALSRNETTLASYEAIALSYAESTRGEPSGVPAEGMERLAATLPRAGCVLELGSGPGWDADHLEASGVRVRRTDGAAAFCVFQAERGKRAERLDLVHDELASPGWPRYDGILCLYVLQHLERVDVHRVLAKTAGALRPGGAALFSVREGVGADWGGGTAEHALQYFVSQWTEQEFDTAVAAAGLVPAWRERHTDDEGDWLFVLVRNPPPLRIVTV